MRKILQGVALALMVACAAPSFTACVPSRVVAGADQVSVTAERGLILAYEATAVVDGAIERAVTDGTLRGPNATRVAELRQQLHNYLEAAYAAHTIGQDAVVAAKTGDVMRLARTIQQEFPALNIVLPH